MKKKILVVIAIVAILVVSILVLNKSDSKKEVERGSEGKLLNSVNKEANNSETKIHAKNLEIPWGLELLPNGEMLVTERPGNLLKINGKKEKINLEQVKHTGEGGLLGVETHPKFEKNKAIYLYFTKEENGKTINTIKRFNLINNSLKNGTTIIDKIPGAPYHDGGRLEFGPDKKLYATTGDATKGKLSQNKSSLAGKILRINPDGSIPKNNPFENYVYSYGHRNPQGIDWDGEGKLWQTEHGPSGFKSGLDEINLIEKGENYGWPEIRGNENKENMNLPKAHSGRNETWAPADATYFNKSLFFTGLKGSSVYKAKIRNKEVKKIESYFKNEFGRIRTIETGPKGKFYITTSNKDGRGNPKKSDDKILKIEPKSLY